MGNTANSVTEQVSGTEAAITSERDEALIRERLETYRAIIANNLSEGFTQMPDQVRKDATLSRAAKLVYEQLLCYTRQKDCCWPSQQTIAEAIVTISRRTVIRAIKELYQRGYIEVWRRGLNRTNIYYINPLTFPQSFKFAWRGQGVRLDAHGPEVLRSVINTPMPDILIHLSGKCQNDTSESAKTAHQEAPNWHTKHTESSNTQVETNTDKSKIRLPQGVGVPNPAPTYSHIEPEAIRNSTGTKSSKMKSVEQIELSNKSNEKETGGAARAKEVNKDEMRKKPRTFEDMAALIGIASEALADMRTWLRENPRPEVTPLKLQGVIPMWSRELGNAEPHLIAANITQASKLYKYARINGLGQQAVEECFEHARGAVSNHPKVNNKMAFFFTSLKLDILVALKQRKDLPASSSAIPDGYNDDQVQEQDTSAEDEAKESYYTAPGDSLRGGKSLDTDIPEAPAIEPILLPPDYPQPDWKTWEAAARWGERLRDELDPSHQIARYKVRPTEDGRFGFEFILNGQADPMWEEILGGCYVTTEVVEQSLDAIRSVRGQAPRNTRFSRMYGKREV